MSTPTDEEKRKLYAGERLYSAAEVALEKAALLREAAAYCLNRAKQLSLYRKEYNPAEVKEIERLKFAETQLEIRSDEILAIPTDQSALRRVEAERLHHENKWREYERDYILPLFKMAKDRGFDLQELVLKTPGKNCVMLYVEWVEAAAYARAKRNAAMECDKKDNLPSEIRRRILALEDRGREAEK